jgi:hypothetical protein
MTGIRANAATASQLALSEAGTCNHDRDVRGARCLAVVTKTSASASALGNGFSKVNKIFTANKTGSVALAGVHIAIVLVDQAFFKV